MPGWQDFDATGAAFQGFEQAQTVQNDIADRRIDTTQKQVDLDTTQKSLERANLLTDMMKAAGPAQGNTPTEKATNALWTASQAAAAIGDIVDSTKAANAAAGIQQNEVYAESISLQKHQATIKDMVSGLGTVHDEASWKEFVTTFPKTHPPEGEFGTMGVLTDSTGQPYPYDPARVEALRNGGMTGLQRVQADLDKARIKSEKIRDKQMESTIRLNDTRAQVAKEKEARLAKAGGKALKPTAADINLISDAARKDGVDDSDDPQVKSALKLTSAEAAENIPQYMAQGMTRERAAKRAYQDAKKAHAFAGLPTIKDRDSQIKGSRDRPATIPVGKNGKSDLTKLKADSFVMGTGKYKGQLLYWDGKNMTTAEAAPGGAGLPDDSGDEGDDDGGS